MGYHDGYHDSYHIFLAMVLRMVRARGAPLQICEYAVNEW